MTISKRIQLIVTLALSLGFLFPNIAGYPTYIDEILVRLFGTLDWYLVYEKAPTANALDRLKLSGESMWAGLSSAWNTYGPLYSGLAILFAKVNYFPGMQEVVALRVFNALSVTLALLLFVGRTNLQWYTKLLVVLLTLTNPLVLVNARQCHSYIMVVNFLLVALTFVNSEIDKPGRRWHGYMLFLGLPILFNHQFVFYGLALLSTLFVYYFLKYRRTDRVRWLQAVRFLAIWLVLILAQAVTIRVLKGNVSVPYWVQEYAFRGYPSLAKPISDLGSVYGTNLVASVGWLLVVLFFVLGSVELIRRIKANPELIDARLVSSVFLLIVVLVHLVGYWVNLLPLSPTRHSIALFLALAFLVVYAFCEQGLLSNKLAPLALGCLVMGALPYYPQVLHARDKFEDDKLMGVLKDHRYVSMNQFDLLHLVTSQPQFFNNVIIKQERSNWSWYNYLIIQPEQKQNADTALFWHCIFPIYGEYVSCKSAKPGVFHKNSFDFEPSEVIDYGSDHLRILSSRSLPLAALRPCPGTDATVTWTFDSLLINNNGAALKHLEASGLY